MIDLKTYLMGRDKIYPISEQQKRNAVELLRRVNNLLVDIDEEDAEQSSGYRPGHFNKKAGGSARSAHLTCEGIDLKDYEAKIKNKITRELLEKHDLYLEHPDYTLGWAHLDTKKRKNRIFIPY